MDVNHQISRYTNGWLSPKFKVVYSASPQSPSPDLETVFDAPEGIIEQFSSKRKSLPNAQDRIEFVKKIAKKFNHLMATRRPYMDGELRKISNWMSA